MTRRVHRPVGNRQANGSGSIEFLAFVGMCASFTCGFGYLTYAAASRGYVIPAALFSVVALFAAWCTALQSCHRG